jgi:hypothetical protein
VSLVQVNYRVPSELRDAIKARAEELGVGQSELVRKGLEAALVGSVGLLEPSERPDGPPARLAQRKPEDGGKSIDLALLLSRWTGMPKAIMARRIVEGRVTMNGEVITDPLVSFVGSRDAFALDGVSL